MNAILCMSSLIIDTNKDAIDTLAEELTAYKYHVMKVANQVLNSKDVLKVHHADRKQRLSLFCRLWLRTDPKASKEMFLTLSHI